MNLSEQYNKNENKNQDNLKSRNDYSTNFIGSNKNKFETQRTPKTEYDQKHKKSKTKKAKTVSKLITTFATMVSAIFLVAAVGNVMPVKDTYGAQIREVHTTETDIFFYVTLDNFEVNDDVYVVLFNDFTNRSQKLEEAGMQGMFENLQTNMTYTLGVKSGSKLLTSKTVKTVVEKREVQDIGTTNPDPNGRN